MRKLILTVSILSLLLLPRVAQGIDLGFDKTQYTAEKAGYSNTTDDKTFAGKIGIGIRAAMSLVGVFFLALMVYAGYLWMTARGEEEPVNKAQKIIMASIIGMLLVAGSYSITAFILPSILNKTTGKPEATPLGGGKVPCCYLCTAGSVDCPKEHVSMSEKDCKALKGNYVGLKTESECQ